MCFVSYRVGVTQAQSVPLSDSRLANLAARSIGGGWASFSDRFLIVTRRARLRFAERDWDGMASDQRERLGLYTSIATEVAADVRRILGSRLEDRMIWMAMKAVYSGAIQNRSDWDLAETFFNSVTRRIFSTVGVDPRIEFVDTDFDAPPIEPAEPVFRTFDGGVATAELVEEVLGSADIGAPFRNMAEDSALAAERIDDRLRRVGGLKRIDRADVLRPVFYRGRNAYVIGRLYSGSQVIPLVLALAHAADGVVVDAVLLTENQVSILFSFTRSYFHVDWGAPNPLVHYLATLMPRKRRAELYIAIGHNKHGKTELYRELRRHMAFSGERFEIARGTEGLVMVVFTLPGFDVVVKVIRDRFGAPKQVSRDQVMSKYRFVFRHDRAGRLVDAQEFEHLEFPVERFDDELRETLLDACARTVSTDGEVLTIAHAYLERRVTPLDVYLAESEPAAARQAVLDYGRAIGDLAVSGIFPGDMLLKNFGVTRHGRVVFYDYDELVPLEDCQFRAIPQSLSIDDEMAAEPWFSVGPGDVFPEEFETFLGLQGDLRRAFLDCHADLFDFRTWRDWQRRVAGGEQIEIFPYADEARLREVRWA